MTSALDSFRLDARAAGVDTTSTDSLVSWIDELTSGGTRDTETLTEDWVTRDDLRSTVWAVASQTYRSASDAIAIVVEFAGAGKHDSLAHLVALDLRDVSAVLHGRSPAEASVIERWLRRSGTPLASTVDADISQPGLVTNCWLGGTAVRRDDLDSAIVSAGIGNTPLVVELDHCYRRFAFAVEFLADESSTTSEAWCTDRSSGVTGWLSRFGGWTPTN